MSVGGPGEEPEVPPVFRAGDDLTQMAARGVPDLAAAAPDRAPEKDRERVEPSDGREERHGREGLRVPPGLLGTAASGEEGQRERTRQTAAAPPPKDQERHHDPSLHQSLDRAVGEAARRIRDDARLGVATGTGRNVGGLLFDPQGADFTLWVSRFKDEVIRNWIPPQSFLWGAARGHVDFEFTVERDGTISSLRVLKSSGTASLDRAAQYALTSSRLLPLPDDYGPPRITIQATFDYEAPRGS